MTSWAKWLWGGMGWAMFGPIGGIMGYALGSMSENTRGFHTSYSRYDGSTPTQAGDFGAAMLILFAAVMKADNELKKSELEFIKKFSVILARGSHPFPSRTRKLSPSAPMVLPGKLGGRVGHCRDF